jgi:rod shape-determining protein MreD
MIKLTAISSTLILAAALFQSTILSRLLIFIPAIPDLALCILVFCAYTNGMMAGQLTGFFSGFLLDFLSAAPLGLNAFMRTLVGGLSGLIKDTVYLDYFFLPMALCAGATIIKALTFFLLNLPFPESVPVYPLTNLTLWIELGLNTLCAPFLFALLRLIKPLNAKQMTAKQKESV